MALGLGVPISFVIPVFVVIFVCSIKFNNIYVI